MKNIILCSAITLLFNVSSVANAQDLNQLFDLMRQGQKLANESPTTPATPANPATNVTVVPPAGKPFRGKVTYQGTYSLTVEKPVPQRDRSAVRIGGISLPITPTTTSEQFNGAITLIVEYDGYGYTVVQKTTGLLDSGTGSGVTTNGTCETTGTGNGNTSRMVGPCNTEFFNGTGGTLPGSRQKIGMSVSTRATEVIDYDVRDAKRTEQAIAAQAQQERARAEQAKAAAQAKVEKDADAARQESLLKSLPPVRVNK